MLDLWKKQFNKDKLFMKHDEPEIFFKSQWQTKEGPSIFYLLYRWVITCYFISTWLLSVIDPKYLDESIEFRVKWTIYLTNWGYTVCLLQSSICTVCLTAWILQAKRRKDTNTEEIICIQRSYKFYWICNIIAVDIAFGVTVLYWALIYDPNKNPLDALNLLCHALNSVVMFIELLVVSHPSSFIHVYWPVLFGFIYIIFSIVYYAAGGTSRIEDPFIYPVLDWSNAGKTIGICVAVLVFIIALHFFTCCIYHLKVYARRKLCKNDVYNKKCTDQEGFDNPVSEDPV